MNGVVLNSWVIETEVEFVRLERFIFQNGSGSNIAVPDAHDQLKRVDAKSKQGIRSS